MGFLSRLFGQNNQVQDNFSNNTSVAVNNTTAPQQSLPMLTVHHDIKDLLWIADGENKNYDFSMTKDKYSFKVYGISFTISTGDMEEPSLIYMGLPISNVSSNTERPPYYPTYRGLTPEQRGMYWKLLANPYDSTIDIGYVFVLYYGLERYLLTDNYEGAIDVILKLRDVHQNKSFQSYTANAVILTCMQRQRADIVQKFMDSLDKEYEYNFSSNLFLLCKFSLGIPLDCEDIMRMSKSFEFTKNNYIKKYPDLFQDALLKNIKMLYKSDGISWDNLISPSEFSKLPEDEVIIFANVSIMDKTIRVPSLLASFKFKKKIYDLLDKTHEDVKKQLAEMRKNGEFVSEKEQKSLKRVDEEVLSFDTVQEQLLLNNYNNARENSLDQHFASIALQDFYYKYRSLGREYLNNCISFCKDDISRLSEIQRVYVEDEKNSILSRQWLTSEEIQKDISGIQPFSGNIPAFKRLAIIYEKEKDYNSAINICEQAISYYDSMDIQSEVMEFNKRKQKLLNKKK